ncbi:MAG: hypothetical protein JWO72_1101 [Caulobacteraceae bacterium]|jgi:UrcA family protein|nr:hypothetical protein [Caulobacteraceae bacterium]
MLRTVMLIAATAASVVPAASAVAQTAQTEQVRTLVVSLSDLNLSDGAAARVALGRIRAAANNVCDESQGDIRDLAAQLRFTSCRRSAMNGAVDKVGSTTVAVAHYGYTFRPVQQAALGPAVRREVRPAE